MLLQACGRGIPQRLFVLVLALMTRDSIWAKASLILMAAFSARSRDRGGNHARDMRSGTHGDLALIFCGTGKILVLLSELARGGRSPVSLAAACAISRTATLLIIIIVMRGKKGWQWCYARLMERRPRHSGSRYFLLPYYCRTSRGVNRWCW